MSLNEWIGSVVSIDCGDVLGTYQGRVTGVDQESQSISISDSFRNGIKNVVPKITINAGDIRDLRIIRTMEEADLMPQLRSIVARTPSKSPEATGRSSSTGAIKKHTKGKGHEEENKRQKTQNAKSNGYDQYSGSVNGNGKSTPSKYTKPHHQQNGYHENGSHFNGNHTKKEPQNESRRRTNSECEPRHRQVSTPKKIENFNGAIPKNQRVKGFNEDAFSAPMKSCIDEFDFQKNLALFDKKAVFQEIENSGAIRVVKAGPKQPANYRHDENVITSAPVVYRQIKVPQNGGREYVTDCGLVVPTVTFDLRRRLIEAAESQGLTTVRQVEMIGRSACEMVMQLLGGATRLTPKNAHQRPQVVILSGPHIQGAMGVNLARQLSTHDVGVTLFVPKFLKMEEHLESELKIYELCDGKRTSSAKDLPSKPIEMVINTLDSHENHGLQHQAWYSQVVDWANQGKAPVLSLDPPVSGGHIDPKWSLGIGLPLDLPAKCGQIYLADMGLPAKVFAKVGIKYSSPFGHKFFTALHPPTMPDENMSPSST